MHWPWGRIQRAGAVALVLLSGAALLARGAWSEDVPFLRDAPGAPWVMAPEPVSAALQQWKRQAAPRTIFTRRVDLVVLPERAVISLRALRMFTLRVNGDIPPGGEGSGEGWRHTREIEVASLLRAGANRIAVDVTNAHGPALLSLQAEGIDLSSADGWQVAVEGGVSGAAIPADDTRVNPASLAVETPVEALRDERNVFVGLFLLGALGLVAGARWLPSARVAWLPAAALGLAALGWAWLIAAKFMRMPLLLGFDVRHHLAYVSFLREHGTVPLATDGWSMYHPPLFYTVAVLVSALGESAPRWIPWLCGLGNVFVARALAARLFEGDLRVQVFATLFAATLPMNLYASAYFSNEVPHALLVGVALVVSVGALLAPATGSAGALAVGLAFGLAALTKFTALAIAPVALFFLVVKLVAVERASLGRVAALGGLAVLGFALVAGWFYVRTWLELGQPLVGNWNLPRSDQVWWQQPGFHTLAYYTGFGEALRHPYQAGFHSFWDGIWSTLWGDGGIGGRMHPSDRHEFWNHGLVSASYLWALPVAGLVGLGAVRCTAAALGPGSGPRRAALSFVTTSVWAVGVSMLAITLALPFFAQAKAFYGLCMIAPLAVFFGAGAARLDVACGSRLVLRAGLAGTLTVALGAFFLAHAT